MAVLTTSPKITPFLWFNNNAEEAITFYCTLFEDSAMLGVSRQSDGSFFTGTFKLAGQTFMALNGGPMFQFNESVSLFVNCRDQEEVDRLWNAFLDNGGTSSQCGWLKDKFGLSWQIIPERLGQLLHSDDKAASTRAMQAMLKMKKLDVAELEKAFNGRF